MPTNLQISESPSVEMLGSRLAEIVLALEPLTESMKEPFKSWFESPVKLLIGNKISLAIIPKDHMWSYILDIDVIYNYMLNIDYLGYDLDFVLIALSRFLSRLGLSMSVNGAMLMDGPMSRKTMTQRSELIGVTDRETLQRLQGGGQ